jgi:hypothetical protein
MTGYSGTPLAKKLGIKDGSVIYAPGAPTEYRELLQPLPAGVRIATAVSASTDIVHLFETERSKLAVALRTLRKKLAPNAAVWVSWPKKSCGVPTTITQDVVRELALPLGFVDIKVCAVTEVWSGLKLVVRKELR